MFLKGHILSTAGDALDSLVRNTMFQMFLKSRLKIAVKLSAVGPSDTWKVRLGGGGVGGGVSLATSASTTIANWMVP
jgi:hypothetical protein